MNVDKDLLNAKFVSGDMEYVFKEVLNISDFILSNNFKIYNADIRDDIKQECAENFLKKIQQGKVNPNKNALFAFIWKNSKFRILEILRKERNRDRIAKFISYDSTDIGNYVDAKIGIGDKYDRYEEM